MILLVSALASASTTFTIGEGQDYTSVSQALAAEGATASPPLEFVLSPDYSPSSENQDSQGDPFGIAFGVDVQIRSSDPGESRPFGEVHAYNGAKVTLTDLEITPVSSIYIDPMTREGGRSIHHAAMLATDDSTLTAERVTVQDLKSQSVVLATNGNIELNACILRGNTPQASDSYPFKNYTIGVQAESGDYALTLVDTVVENASGPAIAAYNTKGSLTLDITGGRIANVVGDSPGSAVLTSGVVDTTVTGLAIENAGNTSVKLSQGTHDWTETQLIDVRGDEGGAFHLTDGGNLRLAQVQCTRCTSTVQGGAVFAQSGTSLVISGLSMIEGGSPEGGAVYADGVGLVITNSRFCAVAADNGALITTSSQIQSLNNIFRNLPIETSIFDGQGGDLEVVNNTFVDNEGPIMTGLFTTLDFVNNAMVNVTDLNAGQAPGELSFGYNLFFDNMNTHYSPELQAGESDLVDVEPGFAEAFLSDPTNCAIDPTPADGSALIDAGDPSILDSNGTRSDIGAFGGIGAEEFETTWSPAQDPNVTLLGGCSGGSSLTAFLLALPLLGLNRKRRKWAEQEQRE